MPKGSQRKCPEGHSYYKSTDCPTCPVCEANARPESGFLAVLSGPARRALENAGIDTVTKLAQHTQKEILALHGMGPASLPKLKQALEAAGLGWR